MESNGKKDVRIEIFKALVKSADGLCAREIKERVGIAWRPNRILRQEIQAGRILESVYDVDNRDVIYYSLSAKGRRYYKSEFAKTTK